MAVPISNTDEYSDWHNVRFPKAELDYVTKTHSCRMVLSTFFCLELFLNIFSSIKEFELYPLKYKITLHLILPDSNTLKIVGFDSFKTFDEKSSANDFKQLYKDLLEQSNPVVFKSVEVVLDLKSTSNFRLSKMDCMDLFNSIERLNKINR